MSGELHELSVAIGELKADVRNLVKALETHVEATTDEHRKVHDIVVATSESIRNVTRRLDAIEPLAVDYGQKRAEARGVARLLTFLYIGFGVSFAAIVNKVSEWWAALPARPHP